ncbi:hypothetical protein PN836_015140 [Ningiella sp. W23]|uniref:hypothetical protein n=1 Tax=Ningiella sp. W23 TaxID=3023715 RepID=UPI0037570E92
MNTSSRSFNKALKLFIFSLATVMLSACMTKGLEMTEQQQRMARCDQYIGMARDDCLNGVNVTIDDYKDEYREFEADVRDKLKAEQDQAKAAAAAREKMNEEKFKEAMKRVKTPVEKEEKKVNESGDNDPTQ